MSCARPSASLRSRPRFGATPKQSSPATTLPTSRRESACSACWRGSMFSKAATTARWPGSTRSAACRTSPPTSSSRACQLRAVALAAKRHGPSGDAYQRAVADALQLEFEALPYVLIENDVKRAKASAELLGETLVLGQAREVLQPMVERSGSLSSDFAPAIVNARYNLVDVLPLKPTLVAAYGSYLAAHQVAKADIWAARDVALAGRAGPLPGHDRDLGQRRRHGALSGPGRARRRTAGADRIRQVQPAGERRADAAAAGAARPCRGAHRALQGLLGPAVECRQQGSIRGQGLSVGAGRRALSTGHGRVASSPAATCTARTSPASPWPAIRARACVVARIEYGYTLKPDPCPSREGVERRRRRRAGDGRLHEEPRRAGGQHELEQHDRCLRVRSRAMRDRQHHRRAQAHRARATSMPRRRGSRRHS